MFWFEKCGPKNQDTATKEIVSGGEARVWGKNLVFQWEKSLGEKPSRARKKMARKSFPGTPTGTRPRRETTQN